MDRMGEGNRRRNNWDQLLQARAKVLLKLWGEVRWIFRNLPKSEVVGEMSPRWVTNPPTENMIPRLIHVAATQPMPAVHLVLIIDGLSAWSDAYTQVVALAALPADQRPDSMYESSAKALAVCARKLTEAAIVIREGHGQDG